MRRLAAILVAASIAVATGVAHADVHGSPESQRLVTEGMTLVTRGKFKEASEKFEAARVASPQASAPLSAFAYMLFWLAREETSPQGQKQLQTAEVFARKALALAQDDPLANEVLRGMEERDAPARPVYQPTAEAAERLKEGEDLFIKGQFEEARLKYRDAQRADPKYGRAFVMEGDSYYAQQNWEAAEFLFLRGAEMDPLDAQAWRFLADVRAHTGNKPGTMEALYLAIGAKPSDQGSWERLAKIQAGDGKSLAHLRLERKARVKPEVGTGKRTIEMLGFDEMDKADTNANLAVWLVYGGALSADIEDGKTESPFVRELRAWSMALLVIGEREVSPDLKQLRMLQQAGQLEAAVLLLMYKETYRPELEAWKKANPDGIAKFVATYRLMP